MQIDTALILCAGFGKRLLPLTKTAPKPLLKIGETTLLEKTIKLIEQIKIKKIKINIFYLSDEIKKFVNQLVNITSKAALASSYHVGKKDKIAADKAAVDSMRHNLNNLDFQGQIVIGP